jgi:hypothetical protein
MAHANAFGLGRQQQTAVGWQASQVGWFLAISGIAFLVPLVFSSILDLHHDLYYLVYFAVTLSVLGAYTAFNEVDLLRLFTRSWKLSLLIGIVSTAFVVWSVLARLESTPHPEGAYFAFEIAWRGLFYGVVDALLLSALPGVVAWKLMQEDISGWARRGTYAALTLLMVVFITATYHLGYEDLRTGEGIGNPELGNSVISLPVIASANPLGSVIAHTSMHLAAVSHSYETEDRLPPQTSAD